jgi:hypothetical protein
MANTTVGLIAQRFTTEARRALRASVVKQLTIDILAPKAAR